MVFRKNKELVFWEVDVDKFKFDGEICVRRVYCVKDFVMCKLWKEYVYVCFIDIF